MAADGRTQPANPMFDVHALGKAKPHLTVQNLANTKGRRQDSWAPGQYETLLARHTNSFN